MRGQSKIHFSESAREAGPTDDDGPKTTRRATASRRIPKQTEPELDPEQAAVYAKQQQAALRAAQLAEKQDEPPESRKSRVVMALFLGLALGAGGVFAYFRHVQSKAATSPDPPREVPTAPDPVTPPVPAVAPPLPTAALPALPRWIAGKVSIVPDDAEVTVDGQPIASRGVLELRGEEGHSFTIELKQGFKQRRFDVMLTDEGPLPDTVSLDGAAVQPQPGPGKPPIVPVRPPPRPLPQPDDDIYE